VRVKHGVVHEPIGTRAGGCTQHDLDPAEFAFPVGGRNEVDRVDALGSTPYGLLVVVIGDDDFLRPQCRRFVFAFRPVHQGADGEPAFAQHGCDGVAADPADPADQNLHAETSLMVPGTSRACAASSALIARPARSPTSRPSRLRNSPATSTASMSATPMCMTSATIGS